MSRLCFAPFTLDPAAGLLCREGVVVPAQPRAVALIAFLAERAGAVVSREALLAGVWPGVKVSDDALHQMIRRARQALGDDAHEPRFIRHLPRRGWSFIATLHGAEPSPPRSPAPAALPPLLGRQALLDDGVRRLSAGERLLLHGVAGVGKTRLARALAAAWPGGALFVDLVRCRSADELRAALGVALGAGEGPADEGAGWAACGALLAARGPILVLLDNVEQIEPSWPEGVATLAALAPAARWAATTQLRRAPEPWQPIFIPPLDEADAITLFVERSPRALDRADPALAALVERLDHLPLALELAARRTRLAGPAEILERIIGSSRLLQREGEDRHDSLDAALQWTWALLPAAEQAALLGLCWLEGSFDLALAEAILGESALDRLEELQDRALLTADALEGSYRLLHRVGIFVRAQGPSQDPTGQWRIRAARCLVERGEALRAALLRSGEGLRSLAELLPALRRVIDAGEAVGGTVALQAGLLAAMTLRLRGPLSEAALLVTSLEAASGSPPELRCRLLHERAAVAQRQGHSAAALPLFEAAAALPPVGLQRGLCLGSLASGLNLLGRHAEALEVAERAWEAAGDRADLLSQAYAAVPRGTALYRLGRVGESIRAVQAGLQALPEGGASPRLAMLANLAATFLGLGRTEEAEHLLDVLSAAARPVLAHRFLVDALSHRCALALQAGRPAAVGAMVAEARSIAAALGQPGLTSALVAFRGKAAQALGQLDEARATFSAALVDFGPLRQPWFSGLIEIQLALLCLVEGAIAQAQEHLDRAAPLLPGCPYTEELRTFEIVRLLHQGCAGDRAGAAAGLSALALPTDAGPRLLLTGARQALLGPEGVALALSALPADRWAEVTALRFLLLRHSQERPTSPSALLAN